MLTSSPILPGIKSIAYVDCEKLSPNLYRRAAAGLSVPVLTSQTAVALHGKPTLKIKHSRLSGAQACEAVLSFASDTLLPIHLNLGFIVETVDGHRLLIGCKEAPFPEVSVEMGTGLPDSDAAGFTYEVKHQFPLSGIPCVV